MHTCNRQLTFQYQVYLLLLFPTAQQEVSQVSNMLLFPPPPPPAPFTWLFAAFPMARVLDPRDIHALSKKEK